MKKTSKDWYAEIPTELGFVLYDPDGWDRSNWEFSFNQELITKEEFVKRIIESTCMGGKKTIEFFGKWKENLKQNSFNIIRVIDLDGVGGQTYEYYCDGCKLQVKSDDNFCNKCGVKFEGTINKDTWGI